MFEVGFWELVVVAVIALIVIGPEQLPSVARNVGFWVGKARRFISSVQTEFSDELKKADNIQKMFKKELEIKELHEKIELDTSRSNVAVPRNAVDNAGPQAGALAPEINAQANPAEAVTENHGNTHEKPGS